MYFKLVFLASSVLALLWDQYVLDPQEMFQKRFQMFLIRWFDIFWKLWLISILLKVKLIILFNGFQFATKKFIIRNSCVIGISILIGFYFQGLSDWDYLNIDTDYIEQMFLQLNIRNYSIEYISKLVVLLVLIIFLITYIMGYDKENQKIQEQNSYWIARILYLRGVAFIYMIGFLMAIQQNEGLIGQQGIMPFNIYLDKLEQQRYKNFSIYEKMFECPTVLWLMPRTSDSLYQIEVIGFSISLILTLGIIQANSILYFIIWVLYQSIVNVGQLFYGYGWESQLIENGFLAIFACPTFVFKDFHYLSPPPLLSLAMMRWLNIRVMLGSGLIKLRGDPCWRNFSCMDYHYETTCVPNFLSYYFHQSPLFVHRFEVLMNHISQLISPLLVIGFLSNRTRILRILSGFLPLGEMLFIQLTGNYGFLNMLTVLPCFSYFDDDFFNNLVPSSWISFALTSQKKFDQYQYQGFSNVQRKFKNIVDLVVLALVGYLSMNPIKNLMSDRQVMNTSYDPFHIIGTYGAFGTVGKDRYEVVLQGTHEIVIHDKTVWYEIEFNCKPTKLNQMPCQISPYHHRIDWQIWFTGFQPHNIGYHPWLAQFVSKLLKGDLNAWNLLNETKNRENFYKDDRTIKPPKFIKADMYRYIFTDMKKKNINWWRRRDQIEYLPPVSLSNPNLIQFLNANGFK